MLVVGLCVSELVFVLVVGLCVSELVFLAMSSDDEDLQGSTEMASI